MIQRSIYPTGSFVLLLSLAVIVLLAGCKRHTVGGCQTGQCTGCCQDDLCEAGDRDSACGTDGEACQDCAVEGLVCTPSGECGSTCDASTCAGCCGESNQCLPGTEDAGCGLGVGRCTACVAGSYCTDWGECHPAVPCLPTTCTGCCDAAGRCRGGSLDEACGQGGNACADCATLGGQCDPAGACVDQAEPCGPGTCAGCCDAQGRCMAGVTPETCGADGAACADCGLEVCTNGTCQPGCQDRDQDGYGPGCALGPDCDDLAPGITGPCREDGCPAGWVLVPEGEFIMGCDDGDPGCFLLAGFSIPQHSVYLTPYCVKRTKVTVAEWRACRTAGHCLYSPCDQTARSDCLYSDLPGENDRKPVVGPGWFTARWLCSAWYGGDLPSGAQWEKAARGIDGRTWPWGNEPEPSCENTHLTHSCAGFYSDVDFFAAWSSPFGLPDTYGWPEWVLDVFDDDEYPPCPAPCVDPLYLPADPHIGFMGTVRGDPRGPPPDGYTYPSIAVRYGWFEWQSLPEPWGRGLSLRCVHRVAAP